MNQHGGRHVSSRELKGVGRRLFPQLLRVGGQTTQVVAPAPGQLAKATATTDQSKN